jgi:hypothetical protein
MDSLVPTQRLWAKINDSITVEKRNTPLWRKAWLIFVAQLGNPSMAMAAGLLIVVGLIAAIWVDRDPVSSPTGPDVAPGVPRAASPATPASSNVAPDVQLLARGDDSTAAVRTTIRTEKRAETSDRDVRRPAAVPAVYMPGEESYVKTIASLSQNVNSANDDVMRPSERVAYERDLAVVNDAISRLRKEVRKNPRNESAKQVLYTSYQNKIDLLNSVSQKEELMASLK